MHKLRRFYYKNKALVWAIVSFIVFLFIVLRFVNYLAARNNKKNIMEANNKVNQSISTTTSTNQNTSVTRDKSLVTGERIDEDEKKIVNNMIENFISYCNNGEIEKAYDLLSDECKEENFKDIDSFKEYYYNNNFKENVKKTATIEKWFGATYQVMLSEDMLSTGKVNDVKIQDYMTIVNQNGEYKLNIHSFIDRVKINKEQTINNLTFNIISKNIYMDYETYTIQVKNNTNNKVLLDTMNSTKSIYLEDTNSVKFYCYTNEIIKEFLKITPNASSQFKLKFMRTYSSSQKDVSLVFSDIVLNYDEKDDSNQNKIKAIIDM